MKLVKQLIAFAITFQFCMPHVYAQDTNTTPDGTDLFSQYVSDLYSDPKEKAYARRLMDFSDRINAVDLTQENPKSIDLFQLVDQRVEEYDRAGNVIHTYNLNDRNLSKPIFSYTAMKVAYDATRRELSFVVSRGEKEDGTGGTKVARQVIANIDIVAMDNDKEMMMMLDAKGRLHAVDMGYVVLNLFQSPIPVFKNLWVPNEEQSKRLEGAQLTGQFLTRGVEPFTLNEVTEDSVVPLKPGGAMDYSAGDFVARFNKDGHQELLGLFSRKVTYERIRQGEGFIQMLATIVKPKEEIIRYVSQNESKIEGIIDAKVSQMEVPASLDAAALGIEVDQLKHLDARIDELRKYGHGTFDRFSYEEWRQSYEELKNKFPSKSNTELAKQWQRWTSLDGENADVKAQDKKLTPEEKVRKDVRDTRISDLKVAGIYCGAIAAFFALGFAYVDYPDLQKFFLLNWIYDGFASELKNLEYRWPLANANAVWIGGALLAPLFVSMVYDKAITALYNFYKNTGTRFSKTIVYTYGMYKKLVNSMPDPTQEPGWVERMKSAEERFAGGVRDHYRKFGPVTDWQRITTFSSYFLSHMIYPVVRFTVESSLVNIPVNLAGIGLPQINFKIPIGGFRQKALVTSELNQLTPWKKVSPDSDLGRAVGLEKPTTLALTNPFAPDESLRSQAAVKQRMQGLLVEQRERADMLALVLASYVVSQKTDVDMATLIQIQKGRMSKSDLKAIFENSDSQKKWEQIATEVSKYLLENDAIGINQQAKDINIEALGTYYKDAKAIAEAVQSQGAFKTQLLARKRNMGEISDRVGGFVYTVGRDDSIFLRNTVTNKEVAQMTSQAFVVDQPMTVMVTDFIGSRTNFAEPEHLAGDMLRGSIAGTPGFQFEMSQNTYIHLTTSGAANALVHQKLRPVREGNYDPITNITIESDSRPQKAVSSIVSMVRQVADYRKSDLGGLAWRGFVKRFNTMQAGFAATYVFRYMVGHQSFDESLKAWALFFLAGTWIYGFWWLPVQQSIVLPAKQNGKRNAYLRTARAEIDQGLREEDPVLSKELLRNGYRRMMRLYDLENPKALEQITQIANIQRFGLPKVELSGVEKKYVGIIYNIAEATKANDTEKLNENVEVLRQALAQDANMDLEQLRRLDAAGVLEMSKKYPPVYTMLNRISSEAANIFGGIMSTVFFVRLSVIVFKPEIMTWGYVAEWMGMSAVLYAYSYYFLSVDGRKARKKFFRNWKESRQLSRTSDAQVPACQLFFK